MNRGITLIETILYLALLSVFLSLALPFLIDLNRAQQTQKGQADAFRDYVFIEAKVQSLVSEFEVVVPRLNATSSMLVLNEDHEGNFELRLNDLLATSTRLSSATFYRFNENDFRKLEMNLVLNGQNFGTTTYLLSN